MDYEDINISPNLKSHIQLELKKNKAYLDRQFSGELYQGQFRARIWELTLGLS